MFRSRDDYREEQAANLMLVGLLCLFAFVVLFVFIGMNTEMAARSDGSTARYNGVETTGSSRSN
jgi:hypothetical protein